MHQENHSEVVAQPIDKAKIRKIWVVAGILAAVTALEFLVAFNLPHEYAGLRVAIFVVMTIVKAYYIVSEFMHLGHEVKSLIWSIMIPTAFIIWLIVALLIQGSAIFEAVNF